MKEHDFGYCYAIEFNNGTVKIGKSVNIIKRLSEHRSSARKFCVDIVDIIFTDVIPLHSDMERELLTSATLLCEPNGPTEYFNGITIYDCMNIFNGAGVNFIRTTKIPTIGKDGDILVSIKSTPEMIAYKEVCDDVKTPGKKNEATKKSKDIVTVERVISILTKKKKPTPPSVIRQCCKSKKLDISDLDTDAAISKLLTDGTIKLNVVIHGKTKAEHTRYELA